MERLMARRQALDGHGRCGEVLGGPPAHGDVIAVPSWCYVRYSLWSPRKRLSKNVGRQIEEREATDWELSCPGHQGSEPRRLAVVD